MWRGVVEVGRSRFRSQRGVVLGRRWSWCFVFLVGNSSIPVSLVLDFLEGYSKTIAGQDANNRSSSSRVLPFSTVT